MAAESASGADGIEVLAERSGSVSQMEFGVDGDLRKAAEGESAGGRVREPAPGSGWTAGLGDMGAGGGAEGSQCLTMWVLDDNGMSR